MFRFRLLLFPGDYIVALSKTGSQLTAAVRPASLAQKAPRALATWRIIKMAIRESTAALFALLWKRTEPALYLRFHFIAPLLRERVKLPVQVI